MHTEAEVVANDVAILGHKYSVHDDSTVKHMAYKLECCSHHCCPFSKVCTSTIVYVLCAVHTSDLRTVVC
jgi:hypothetical protein